MLNGEHRALMGLGKNCEVLCILRSAIQARLKSVNVDFVGNQLYQMYWSSCTERWMAPESAVLFGTV